MADDRDKVEPFKPVPYVRGPGTGRLETEPLWPTFTDPYKAAGSPDNNELPRLVVVLGRDRFKPGTAPAYHLLQYSHIGSGEFGFEADGQWFRFPFHEPKQAKLLTAHGRGILRVCDYISLRRLPWIRLADRDFRAGDGVPDDEPIFTRIVVEPWQPEED